MANTALIRDLQKFLIVEHPEAHDQTKWFSGEIDLPVINNEKLIEDWGQSLCGSTGCVAGWGALMAGWHQVRAMDYMRDPMTGYYDIPVSMGTEMVVDETGRELSMMDAGREALGLTYDQSSFLFSAIRSREEIDKIFTVLIEKDGQDTSDIDFEEVIFPGINKQRRDPDWDYRPECSCSVCSDIRENASAE